MSTRMTSAASCRTRSGTVSRTVTPVILETTSARTLEMLDVERRPNIHARIEQFFNVLPALGMAAVGRVGVSEFVDDHEFGLARQRGVDIEFLDDPAPILNSSARQNFKTFHQGFRLSPPMRFDKTDHHIDAIQLQGPRLRQHRVCLTDAGRCAQKYPQLAA